jgi:hypothetical protein
MDQVTARYSLPHPLALLYGRLVHHDPARQFENLLAFSEGVARFLAWVLTAESAAYGASAPQLRSAMSASGFGSFLNVIKAALDARAKAQRQRFLPELDGITSGAAWAFLDRVKDLRNDASHNRLSREPHAARALLNELSPGLRVLLDALRPLSVNPFGVLRGQETDLDGIACATWLPVRGQTLSNTPVRVRNVAGVPTGVLLLIDKDVRSALTLAPFFFSDDVFCWMDVPRTDDVSRRGYYQRVVPGEVVPEWVPDGLFVAHSSAPQGMKLAEWLSDQSLRPRVVPLSFDGNSVTRIRNSMQPTLAVRSAPSHSADVLASDPPRTPAQDFDPPVPPHFVAQTSPVVSAPPAVIVDHAAPNPWGAPPPSFAPLPATQRAPPDARRGSASAIRSRASSQLWIVLVLATAGVMSLAIWLLLRADTFPSNVTPTIVPTPTLPAPSTPSFVTGPPRGDLLGFLAHWDQNLSAIVRGESASVSAFYSEPTRLRGSGNTLRTHAGVDAYWRNVFRGTIRFNWSTAQTVEETLDPTRTSHAACALMSGAEPGVTLVRVDAVEDNPQNGIETNDGRRCSHIQGKYLLRLRRASGGYQICHDSWSLDEAVCPSCPSAKDCAPQ